MISPVKIWRRQKEIGSLLGKKGKILTWTIIYMAGAEFKKFAPYPVAIIKLENGEKLTDPIVDYEKDDLRIGKKVQSVLRKTRDSGEDGVIPYGLKFRPLNSV